MGGHSLELGRRWGTGAGDPPGDASSCLSASEHQCGSLRALGWWCVGRVPGAGSCDNCGAASEHGHTGPGDQCVGRFVDVWVTGGFVTVRAGGPTGLCLQRQELLVR